MITIAIDITARQICDLLTSCVEGNDMTAAWCAGVYWKDKDAEPPASKKGDGPWYYDASLFEDNSFVVAVHEVMDESEPWEGDNINVHHITYKDVIGGFQLMAQKHGTHFGDWLAESDDAVTADVWLQLVVLKEVVYG